jgi:predicted ATPase
MEDGEMSDRTQHRFRATRLDPELLATPIKVQTNWHVMTGAACCGKTTLIDLLADQGFQTVPETARQLMEKELAGGRTIEEVFEGGAAFERTVMDVQQEIEHGLRETEVIFLDRALPDCLTFFRIFGLNPNEILAECLHHRYASVFILDLLPFQLDGARIEDDTYTVVLDDWLERDYSALGYDVVRVPVLSPQKRLEFVLERVSEQGLL